MSTGIDMKKSLAIHPTAMWVARIPLHEDATLEPGTMQVRGPDGEVLATVTDRRGTAA